MTVVGLNSAQGNMGVKLRASPAPTGDPLRASACTFLDELLVH